MSKFLDEWELGEVFVTEGRTITESDVMAFAGLTGDYHQNHTNTEYMKNSQFGQRIAHGLLGLSFSHGLLFRLNIITDNSIALLGVEDWKFLKPVYFGDTIHAKLTVKEIRFSKTKADRGILKLLFEIINQRGEVCQSGTKVFMMKRKPEEVK
jgi:acyl dehydratase